MLIVHPKIAPVLATMKETLPQALLLDGAAGVGLLTISLSLVGDREVRIIRPELISKSSTIPQISTEVIRDLYTQVRTSSIKGQAIIIDDAEAMTLGAQNAFLKLLEEPNSSTHFILTSHIAGGLLPTIRSRVQHLMIPRANTEDCTQLLKAFDAQKVQQMQFIAGGLPAELVRLAADERYFEAAAAGIRIAKQLVQARSYEALTLILKEISLQRRDALGLIDQIIRLLTIAPTPSAVMRTEMLLAARTNIEKGANVKLQLAAAML